MEISSQSAGAMDGEPTVSQRKLGAGYSLADHYSKHLNSMM